MRKHCRWSWIRLWSALSERSGWCICIRLDENATSLSLDAIFVTPLTRRAHHQRNVRVARELWNAATLSFGSSLRGSRRLGLQGLGFYRARRTGATEFATEASSWSLAAPAMSSSESAVPLIR
jgi:hypothetical protein